MIDAKTSVVITETDFRCLRSLIESSTGVCHRDREHLESLQQELERAVVVEENEVPRDLVTINSRVRVRDLATEREFVYQIVFPTDANVEKNQISVLAPIGTALLGSSAGNTVEWPVPSGLRRLSIVEVEYQPEATRAAA
jgi:regulator of nucleoside diphosphate kinase